MALRIIACLFTTDQSRIANAPFPETISVKGYFIKFHANVCYKILRADKVRIFSPPKKKLSPQKNDTAKAALSSGDGYGR